MSASQSDKIELFRSVPVPKAIATMAIPTIISQLVSLIYNMADTFFIGRTGNSYMVAAATVSMPIFFMTIPFANLFGIGGGGLMARLAGRNEFEQAKSVCAFSFYGGIVSAALYSLVVFAFLDPILWALGASENSIDFARQYIIYVVVIGALPVIGSGTLAHLLRNAGFSKQASYGLSGGGILNMILDPIFMFVIMPDGMEVVGAAIATLISNVASCIYLLFAIIKASKSGIVSLSIKSAMSISKHNAKELFAVGVPSAILVGLFDVGNMFLMRLMSDYGDLSVAALGIVMKIDRIPNAINIGLCQGILPLVAFNYAANNIKRMEKVIRDSRIIGFTTSGIAVVMLRILAPQFCALFINTNSSNGIGAAETVAIASGFLLLRCLASPFQFVNYSISYNMQALGFGGATLLQAIVRICVFYIPGLYVLSHFFGGNGLAAGLAVGEGLTAVLSLILFRYLRRHRAILPSA